MSLPIAGSQPEALHLVGDQATAGGSRKHHRPADRARAL